jgi:predicted HicB family RNase H-like nuclease
MKNTIQYKGYIGSVEFSEEDCIFYGKVMGIRSLISYEGENAKELIADFHGAVDDYLRMCESEGKSPEIAYKGSFNIRISPELHKKLVVYATAHNMSLNSYIEDTLEKSTAAHIL